ncbi:hypothetical protein P7K49_017597 [Saguinus oedipus]|uniref:Uncharacterized protein n=1 Tax=Saguinus oedipus TaxID=9490 RepID=A0ABQ9V3E1_SAGOE|nr:hypothetical protein P7K49_017597 [Saguinus oedipus]
MAHLYGDPEWSQRDLEGPIRHAREHLTKSKLEVFSPERLVNYRRELELQAEQGHPTTFVDLWALVLESMLHGQVLCFNNWLSCLVAAISYYRMEEACFNSSLYKSFAGKYQTASKLLIIPRRETQSVSLMLS